MISLRAYSRIPLGFVRTGLWRNPMQKSLANSTMKTRGGASFGGQGGDCSQINYVIWRLITTAEGQLPPPAPP